MRDDALLLHTRDAAEAILRYTQPGKDAFIRNGRGVIPRPFFLMYTRGMLPQHQARIARASDAVVRRFARDPNVLGVFLIGSAATGTFDAFSDIDFYVIRSTKGRYSRERYRFEQAVTIEILFDTADDIATYIREDHGSLHRNVATMLAEGTLLTSPTPLLQRLQRSARAALASPTKVSHAEIAMHKYSLEDFLSDACRDAKSGDMIAFAFNSQRLMQNALELVLLLHGKALCSPRRMRSVLHMIDPRFMRLFDRAAAPATASVRLAALKRLIAYCYRVTGGQLPEHWRAS